MIQVVVRGGPEGLSRIHQIDEQEPPDRLTVAYYGQHQHFVRTEFMQQVEGRDVPVFQWTYSTAIAE
ncbi:DUF5988 family protein [Streptomyces sp. NPDC055078]